MASQELEREIGIILATAEDALDTAKKVQAKGDRSPVDTLQYQLGMLEIIRQLEKVRAEMYVAREDLAGMINLPPGVPLQLLDDSGAMADALQSESIKVEDLERFALAARPELRVEFYQDRIEADEAKKAIARLFPGLELNLGGHYDSNSLLLNQKWMQAGTRLSWNILRLFTEADRRDLFEVRKRAVETRRLAQHMAILTQSRIAYHEYLLAQRDLKLSSQEEGVRGQLKEHIGNRSRLGLDSQLKYVRSAAEATLGRIRQFEAYSRYQNALGTIYATMGMDVGSDITREPNLQMLARNLRWLMRDWDATYLANKSNPKAVDEQELPVEVIDMILDAGHDKTVQSAPQPASSKNAAQAGRRAVTSQSDLPKTVKSPKLQQKRFGVQVGAFADKERPDIYKAVINQLQNRGYSPFVREVQGEDGTDWRLVWLGSYATKSEALTVRDQFKKNEGMDAFIATVQVNP